MGLKNTLQNAAKKAIAATGDIAVKVTYYKFSSEGVYDSGTGLVSDVYTAYPDVAALECRLTEDDMDWSPANNIGEKLLIAYKDLPIEIDAADYVVIGTKRWNVFKRKEAPGTSLHIIYLHLPQAV